jgi:hypothetical protein
MPRARSRRRPPFYQHSSTTPEQAAYKTGRRPGDLLQHDNAGIRPDILHPSPFLLEEEFEQSQRVGEAVPGFEVVTQAQRAPVGKVPGRASDGPLRLSAPILSLALEPHLPILLYPHRMLLLHPSG